MASTIDHPVFQRLTRQQQIYRRRHIGYQTLILQCKETKNPRCTYCGRLFTPLWQDYLCHMCGLWVCLPCSVVLEREREPKRIQYMRACYSCFPMLNRWTDPDLSPEFTSAPLVRQSSKSQLALNLSDILCAKPESRHAVLVTLKYLGVDVKPFEAIVENICEAEWVAAATLVVNTRVQDVKASDEKQLSGDSVSTAEIAQSMVQQCFDLVIEEIPLCKCKISESEGVRTYPIFYRAASDGDANASPHLPPLADEDNILAAVARLNILDLTNCPREFDLICKLVAKEFDCSVGAVGAMVGDILHIVSTNHTELCGLELRGSDTFGPFHRISNVPFLVRNALLDIRFREFESVRVGPKHRFIFSVPILSKDGCLVASLLAMDSKPRGFVTTMQYSIMKKLASAVTEIWSDAAALSQATKAPHASVCIPFEK